MTKQEALSYADGSVVKLAGILGIEHPAVSQWSEDKIPELRAYQLREMFGEPKSTETQDIEHA